MKEKFKDKIIIIITISILLLITILLICNILKVPKLKGNAMASYKVGTNRFFFKTFNNYKINGKLASGKNMKQKLYSVVINYDEKDADVLVKYKIYSNGKWSKWKQEGKKASSIYPIQAIRIKTKNLKGNRKNKLYYRTFVKSYGWLNWTTDDIYYNEISGTTSKNDYITALEIIPVSYKVKEEDLSKYLKKYDDNIPTAFIDE